MMINITKNSRPLSVWNKQHNYHKKVSLLVLSNQVAILCLLKHNRLWNFKLRHPKVENILINLVKDTFLGAYYCYCQVYKNKQILLTEHKRNAETAKGPKRQWRQVCWESSATLIRIGLTYPQKICVDMSHHLFRRASVCFLIPDNNNSIISEKVSQHKQLDFDTKNW